MKHIYLIRHGETEANKTHFHQSSDEPLSPKGHLQSEHISGILKKMQIDTLLCSSYTRARQTAEIISRNLDLPYTTTSCVVEFKRPDYLYGESYYSWHTMWYMWQLFAHSEDKFWDNDGAENMVGIRNRIVDTKHMIMECSGTNIAIVTHDIFMNMFLEFICREKKLTLWQFVHVLLATKKTPNTGIFHLQYDEGAPKGVCAWQLIEIIDPTKKNL